MIRLFSPALLIGLIAAQCFAARANAAIASRVHIDSASNAAQANESVGTRPTATFLGAPGNALVGSVQALLSTPKSDDATGNADVKPMRVLTEMRVHRELFRAGSHVDYTFWLQPGEQKIIRPGRAGLRVVTEKVTTWDSIVVDRQATSRLLLRDSKPGYVLRGAPRTLDQLSATEKIGKLVSVMTMVATAYTASSASPWSTGYTATGMLARYGVVAVDPRIIPLGSRLFIPGYGIGVAADTGGAIIGNRVDLCYNTIWEALQFGRRVIQVYILRQDRQSSIDRRER